MKKNIDIFVLVVCAALFVWFITSMPTKHQMSSKLEDKCKTAGLTHMLVGTTVFCVDPKTHQVYYLG